MIERRTGGFTEKLSWFMAIVAALGGIYVILDPVITIEGGEWGSIRLGGDGFAEQLKGAVVALILIEGWKAVKEYWLGSSAGGQKNAEVVGAIAVGAAPAQAEAVAAARSEPVPPAPASAAPIVAENVNVEAQNATLTERKDP